MQPAASCLLQCWDFCHHLALICCHHMYDSTCCPLSVHLSCHYWPALCTNLQSPAFMVPFLLLQPWFHLRMSFLSTDALAASTPPSFHSISTLPLILTTTRPLSLCGPWLVILWLHHIILSTVFLVLPDIHLFIVKCVWQKMIGITNCPDR